MTVVVASEFNSEEVEDMDAEKMTAKSSPTIPTGRKSRINVIKT